MGKVGNEAKLRNKIYTTYLCINQVSMSRNSLYEPNVESSTRVALEEARIFVNDVLQERKRG